MQTTQLTYKDAHFSQDGDKIGPNEILVTRASEPAIVSFEAEGASAGSVPLYSFRVNVARGIVQQVVLRKKPVNEHDTDSRLLGLVR